MSYSGDQEAASIDADVMHIAWKRPGSAGCASIRSDDRCATCLSSSQCLSRRMMQGGFAGPEDLQLSNRRIKAGEAVYRIDDPFHAFYVVRMGLVKAVTMLEGGREQVSAFYMPADAFGMDGIAYGHYTCDAVAVEDSDVCVLPYEALERLSRRYPQAQQILHQALSAEIARRQDTMAMLSGMTAEQRVAAFLLDHSQRLHLRGQSPSQFLLRVSRHDIASLLGLTVETVSRTMSRLKHERLLDVDGKHVHLLSVPGLRRLLATP
jgi:CRP/FNR family transcriptional regulator